MATAKTGAGPEVTSVFDEERVLVSPGEPTAPAQRGGPRAGAARIGTRVGLPALVAGAIIGLWYLISDLVLNSYQRFMLPPPHRVLEVGFFTWSNFTALVSAL